MAKSRVKATAMKTAMRTLQSSHSAPHKIAACRATPLALLACRALTALLALALAGASSAQQLPSSSPAAPMLAQPSTPQLPDSVEASPGSIRGVVQSQDGSVYEGVHVTLTRQTTEPGPPQSTITDSNGRFTFPAVLPGTFQLTIAAEGFTPQTVSGLLHPGESYEAPAINLAFANAVSEVRVTASQVEIAEAQLKDEEKQRVFGIVPNFYVAYAPDAPPLTSKQKFRLAWRSSIDPVTFGITGLTAGVEQADNAFSGYGQGAQGYAKRFGASYADNFIGTMIGSAILPALLKQDPRYFYKGTGTVRSRVLYAIANSVICKGDNGRWQPNYSSIVGSLAAGGISNLYYPASDRDGASLTFEETALGAASSAVQNIFQEFIVRKFTPKLPNYRLTNP